MNLFLFSVNIPHNNLSCSVFLLQQNIDHALVQISSDSINATLALLNAGRYMFCLFALQSVIIIIFFVPRSVGWYGQNISEICFWNTASKMREATFIFRVYHLSSEDSKTGAVWWVSKWDTGTAIHLLHSALLCCYCRSRVQISCWGREKCTEFR